MSKREKTLALIVGSLLPLLLVFWVLTSFSNSYFAKRQKIRALQNSISEENDRLTGAQLAQQRRRFYSSISMPTDVNQAKVEYEGWLGNLIEKESKLTLESIAWGKSPTKIRFRNANSFTDVGEQFSCTARAYGTLDQIKTMLSGFERLNLLHRIDSINISEVTQGSTTGRPMNQGKLKLEMEVFVLKMNDAAEMWDFTSKENELIVDHTNIANAIVTRNFFGPANNPPTITTSNRSLKTDEEVSFEIAASDPDNDDLLKIELVSTDIPDAKLVQENETDRKAEFQASNLAAGKYELVVRVTDTGLPYKSVEKSIVVNVSEPVAAAPPPPKPAPFKHAQGTYVTGFKGDTLWVNIKTLNEMKFVDVGGSFELDGDVWTVISIESWRKIVISCNGKLLTYRIGDTLDAPRETTIIDVKKTADADLSGG